jgi:hypothetical protein
MLNPDKLVSESLNERKKLKTKVFSKTIAFSRFLVHFVFSRFLIQNMTLKTFKWHIWNQLVELYPTMYVSTQIIFFAYFLLFRHLTSFETFETYYCDAFVSECATYFVWLSIYDFNSLEI